MNVLSLYDGISCGQVALERAKIKVSSYTASEIDKHVIKITQRNYPNTIQVGDVQQVNGNDYPFTDLLIGGSPCQSLSDAGNGSGFEGKSGLFWEYVRILLQLRAINPRILFLLENVSMKKVWEDVITKALGVSPITINSSLVSGQHRERLYWTNIPAPSLPEDKGILLKDILCVPEEKYYHSPEAIAYMNRQVKGGRTHWDFKHHSDTANSKSACITRNIHKGVPHNVLIDRTSVWNGHFLIRRFTPIECERLQTLPDNYTEGISDTQRYIATGNGWTVDVIAHIFKNLKK